MDNNTHKWRNAPVNALGDANMGTSCFCGLPRVMDWEKQARGILRAEMSRRQISYKMLVARLDKMGVEETYKSVASKINRGTFSFVFFLQAAQAMGIQFVDLSLVDEGKEQ